MDRKISSDKLSMYDCKRKLKLTTKGTYVNEKALWFMILIKTTSNEW